MQVAGSVSISGILDRVLQRRRWAHIVETRRDGVFRAICGVALLAKGACHSLRNASCSSSRKNRRRGPEGLDQRFLRYNRFGATDSLFSRSGEELHESPPFHAKKPMTGLPTASISPALTPEQKLSGDMLLFSTGLMVFASVLWLAVYWSFGQRFSTLIPLVFQGISVLSIVLYLRTKKL